MMNCPKCGHYFDGGDVEAEDPHESERQERTNDFAELEGASLARNRESRLTVSTDELKPRRDPLEGAQASSYSEGGEVEAPSLSKYLARRRGLRGPAFGRAIRIGGRG